MKITQDIINEFGEKTNDVPLTDKALKQEFKTKSEECKEAGGDIYIKISQ